MFHTDQSFVTLVTRKEVTVLVVNKSKRQLAVSTALPQNISERDGPLCFLGKRRDVAEGCWHPHADPSFRVTRDTTGQGNVSCKPHVGDDQRHSPDAQG